MPAPNPAIPPPPIPTALRRMRIHPRYLDWLPYTFTSPRSMHPLPLYARPPPPGGHALRDALSVAPRASPPPRPRCAAASSPSPCTRLSRRMSSPLATGAWAAKLARPDRRRGGSPASSCNSEPPSPPSPSLKAAVSEAVLSPSHRPHPDATRSNTSSSCESACTAVVPASSAPGRCSPPSAAAAAALRARAVFRFESNVRRTSTAERNGPGTICPLQLMSQHQLHHTVSDTGSCTNS
jgi:hypothetical protein